MVHIYQNAYLTVSATWGLNGAAGCFHSTYDVHGPVVQVRTPKDAFDVSFRYAVGHEYGIYGKGKPRTANPALGRAWIYQERILEKNRVLYV